MNLPHKPNQFGPNRFIGLKLPETEDPKELVEWSVRQFSSQRMVLTTAFGMEGCALIDIYSRSINSLTVAYIDTGFFFPETKQLIKRMTQKYSNVNFVRWESPVSVKEQNEKFGTDLWQSDPNLCCKIRKVVPMTKNILDYEVWVTGIRKTQTKQRAQTSVLSWNEQYQVTKFCPFAHWERQDVWNYIQVNDVPFNQLHQQGFPSIGCFYCTKAVPNSRPTDDSRAGRWQGHVKTECGLHYSS